MTDEIFRRDGYGFEFEANVVSVSGDEVILDSTAFYPGGGGQVCDTGSIRGNAVTEVYTDKNGDIVHKVPGNDLKPGERIWCSVDWDRRYDLMQGHTGEHLLFCSLRRQCEDLAITKIYISPESKYVIVNHDLTWEQIGAAVRFANQAIADNLPVTHSVMDRDDPDLEKVRIKLDRIPEGEEITVVAIGDIDLSACSGIHVMETSELEMLLVDRKVSAGAEGTAIHFKVGKAAKDEALALSGIALEIVDGIGCKTEDSPKAVANARADAELKGRLLKQAAKKLASSAVPEKIGGKDVYCVSLPGTDRAVLTEFAESVKSKGGVALVVGVTDTLAVIMASGDPAVDCRKLLPEVLKPFGGRGGGKPDFAQGGIQDVSAEDDVLKALRDAVAKSLN
ncbi:MAG: DHHA1 domain-containing protein [Thermoplasmata archaeon]|nr:DHHA1 domain-containing protein [Thermoplasmata archaeon]